jgi:hypothetical protein
MRYTEHVARMLQTKYAYKISVVKAEWKRRVEHLSVNGWIILKWIVMKHDEKI